MILDQLKVNLQTRHIPVQVLSITAPLHEHIGKAYGVFAQQDKPSSREEIEEIINQMKEYVEKPNKHLLALIGDDIKKQQTLELIGNGDIHVTAASSLEDGLTTLLSGDPDCLLLDGSLPDKAALRILKNLTTEPHLQRLPVVLQGPMELTAQEKAEFDQMSKQLTIKEVTSNERLFGETALFLHRASTAIPDVKHSLLREMYTPNRALAGKKMLIVDDDIRNIFALTSLLENYGVEVLSKDNGKGAIELLKRTPEVDIVLKDMMMPEYDGYETMREIRSYAEFKNLPIIALTAKAMKGDRQKCIEAGACDYIAKPVNKEQLLSALRVWTCC